MVGTNRQQISNIEDAAEHESADAAQRAHEDAHPVLARACILRALSSRSANVWAAVGLNAQ